MLTRRSRAREVALQLLFQVDQNSKPVPRTAIEDFVRERLRQDAVASQFCLSLYDGVRANQTAIDATLTQTAENWKLKRMLPVDRNVLRLGTYELIYASEPTPAAVAMDEAIELSRRFGSKDSPGFVNGILDKIHRAKSAVAAIEVDVVAAQTETIQDWSTTAPDEIPTSSKAAIPVPSPLLGEN